MDTQYGQYGTLAYVIEANSSPFQPNYSSWRNLTVNRQRTAWQYFLNNRMSRPGAGDGAHRVALTARIALQEVSLHTWEKPPVCRCPALPPGDPGQHDLPYLTATMPGYCTETREVAVGSGPVAVDIALRSFPLAPSITAQGLG